MPDIVPAIAIGLHANAIVGPVKMNALGPNILGTARNLAANRQPVPMHEGAVGNCNVTAWIIRAR